MIVLAGDVGGTKTQLGLFEVDDDGRQRSIAEERYESAAFDGLGPMIQDLLADAGNARSRIEAACFGVAAPVADGSAQLTNLPWSIDARALAGELGLRSILLINDLVATAEGIATLSPGDFFSLQDGDPDPSGNRLVIAAGTGLGVALVVPAAVDGRDTAIASEGGHADFAPRSDLEFRLRTFLAARHGHVSNERVVSGPGLASIHEFLRRDHDEDPAIRAAREASDDLPRFVTEMAQQGSCAICTQALRIFMESYGAVAGSYALITLATGGVYVGGGIAPKIAHELREGPFVSAFRDKGRFADLLRRIPIRGILEPKTALKGAARHAHARAVEDG